MWTINYRIIKRPEKRPYQVIIIEGYFLKPLYYGINSDTFEYMVEQIVAERLAKDKDFFIEEYSWQVIPVLY